MERVYERPFRPIALGPDTLSAFPLGRMIEQLRSEPAYRDSGRDALTLVHGPGLTMVLTVARDGTECGEHRQPGTATIVVLSGALTISPAGRVEPMTVETGSVAILARGFAHMVRAERDSAFLTIIGPQGHEAV